LALFLALLISIASATTCDIYASGGTPCVCAHSTIRALYATYNGPLYQVQRQNDRKTMDIHVVAPGSHANASEQENFCYGTTCLITIIYDQSTHNNHLTVGTPGGANPKGNTPAVADAETIFLKGNKVYPIHTTPGQGYFHDGSQSGISTGSAAEGIYMVTAGNHVNSGCCFDYGNAEANRRDNGAAHMNAIYFGTACCCGNCPGSGPWIFADLENGLYAGGSNVFPPTQKAWTERFVTAMEKTDGTSHFILRGGNAQAGGLTTLYTGDLPKGYAPLKKEGGIILGTGGDDSSWSEGTFYEGAMVRGEPSDDTENAVHENIVAAGYDVK